jgi:methyl coenzyme M reductase subunit C
MVASFEETISNEMTDEPAGASGFVEVVLYLNPGSATSAKARRNLDAALRDYAPSSFRLIVRDVSQDLAESEADHIVFTPTLIVRHAQAPCVIVGDLADTATVAAMLGLGGMERAG